MNWKENSRTASHWQYNEEQDKVQCNLCPRHCNLKAENKFGFCQVRGRIGKELHTFNFGRSVTATIECIETEAVNHYAPGSKILSLGNIGCMMACSYCQNWQTSQVKHLDNNNVKSYSPEDVINLAKSNDIKIISWTYNDPVVWHEFVVETSKLAKKNNIKTLYKSALYIELEPLRELIDVIDIFSISLKSMDSEIYRKQTKGRLEPVLEAIKEIAKSNKHLEISQLIVTDLNDDGVDAKKTAKWIIDNVGSHIPLHLVGYHPAYRYTKERTSLSTLSKLRDIAIQEGIEYCYLGSVYDADVSNTHCKSCKNKLVERFGLSVKVVGLEQNGCCSNCGAISPIKHPLEGKTYKKSQNNNFVSHQTYTFKWDKEVKSLHILLDEQHKETIILRLHRKPSNQIEFIEFNNGLERVIISKSSDDDSEIEIQANISAIIHYLPVLDRAHFPVIEIAGKQKKYLN
jgi:pyruvate formate lyase activating enzyme